MIEKHCKTCDHLVKNIQRAGDAGDRQRERVMRGLLKSHLEQIHGQQRQVEAVVEWENGTVWEVVR